MADVALENKENAEPEEDPYAVSSDSEDDDESKPPPMIQIGERQSDLKSIKNTFASDAAAAQSSSNKKEPLELEGIGKDQMSNIKGAFEEGQNGTSTSNNKETSPLREKLTAIDKEKYSQFKNKFEHIDQGEEDDANEKRKRKPEELEGIDAETLSKTKGMFESPDLFAGEVRKTEIDIQRTDADKKRVDKAFKKPKQQEEAPKDCAVCGKLVYSVEKLAAEKKVFHKTCFKCNKCGKGLSVTSYHSHKGELLCKPHMMEIFRPEAVAHIQEEGVAGDGEATVVTDDEDEEYAVVSKPKSYDPSVVRSGLKSQDDFSALPSLKHRTDNWEQSVEQAKLTERPADSDLGIQQGKVKASMNKFTDSGVENEEGDEELEDQEERDPNIVRESKHQKKEQLHFEEVGQLKQKWKTGEVQRADEEKYDRSDELEEIKKGVSIRERFREKTGQELDEATQDERASFLEREGIDTSLSSEARNRFLKGEPFDTPVDKAEKFDPADIQFKELAGVKEQFEKAQQEAALSAGSATTVDARCEAIGDLKSAFEKGNVSNTSVGEDGEQEDDETLDPVERKRRSIESEFKRFKVQRRKQELKEQRLSQTSLSHPDVGTIEIVPYQNPDDVRQCAEMGSIKDRFEKGVAFQGEETVKRDPKEELDIKVAGKARQKFQQIDQTLPKDGTNLELRNATSEKDSKWTAKDAARVVPEAINKRVKEDSDDEDADASFEVKDLLSKFQRAEQPDDDSERKPKPKRVFTPPPEGYRAEIESEAAARDPSIITSTVAPMDGLPAADTKNLKARFEGTAEEIAVDAEEKKRQLEEEFKAYKEEKEKLKTVEGEDTTSVEQPTPTKEEIQVAADHAKKMTQKWEKLEKKEAKKAQKAAYAKKTAAQLSFMVRPTAALCFMCDDKVYMAEQIEIEGQPCHRRCFRCRACSISLRVETYGKGVDGVYCQKHHKELVNNISKPLYDGGAARLPTMVA